MGPGFYDTCDCPVTELWSAKIEIIEKKLENVDKMSSFCDPLTNNYGIRKDSVTMSRKIPQSLLQNIGLII